ncbi:hypothetical protein GCM10011390_46820 [Aureimonas endophytica]|uniref:AB hydrolase-1 domain-containing protein n=1 Tax=Aureimonas endophytica TaxID=2027858 RepID=A0A917ECE9_9HYPH|nr:alpha/beta fold hydrolase [Aureimonas endophytica]GGE22092.1 hypothetical protein GCM10011390_46820 [Aureimonas endophytica]
MTRLVLVPAFACDAALYAPLLERLGGDFEARIVVADRPSLAECVGQVLAAAGGGAFVVGGTSFGGHVARETALAAPDRVAGLLVMGAGAAAPADPAPLAARRAAIEGGRQADMLEAMAKAIVFEPEGRGRSAAGTFRDMARRAAPALLSAQTEALATRPDRRSDLGRLRCPTLLVWGDSDEFSPPATGADMAQAIPDAEFVLLPHCGHLPSLEAPDAVAAAIRARFGP